MGEYQYFSKQMFLGRAGVSQSV